MGKSAQKIVSPRGELMYVFITEKGRKDLNDNDRFTASIRLHENSDDLAEFKKKVDDFWKEYKPKGAKKYKSNGIKRETVPNPDDPEGDRLETEYFLINFWTGISFPDGTPKTVNIYNMKKDKVDMGSKKIGNGSIGYISGAMDIYDQGKGAQGVTLYLNAIQLKKFVEYTGEDLLATPDDVEDDDFLGFDEDTGFEKGEEKLDLD